MTGNDVQVAEPRRSRRRWVIAGAVVGVLAVLAAVVLVVFQPQRLLFDDEVDEAVPTAATPSDPTASGDPAAPAPSTAPLPDKAGSFISLAHGTDGRAQILTVGTQRYLRIEDLDTDNGPDLRVYLTSTAAEGDEDTFDDDFVELGALKGNVGNQNYELPADVDLSTYDTVVIWCDRFDVAFGAADLT